MFKDISAKAGVKVPQCAFAWVDLKRGKHFFWEHLSNCLSWFVNRIGSQEDTWVSDPERNSQKLKKTSRKNRDSDFHDSNSFFKILLLLLEGLKMEVLIWSCTSWEILQEERHCRGEFLKAGQRGIWRWPQQQFGDCCYPRKLVTRGGVLHDLSTEQCYTLLHWPHTRCFSNCCCNDRQMLTT